jgi:hypothetical protein
MDIPQLKLLAGRVRDLLKQSSHTIGHSQSLDLISALPGLRNWPEVMAFPARVAACELDATSSGRLSFRLKKNFALDVTAKDLLAELMPENAQASNIVPQVWPGGPTPGVYVTTSQDAINALLVRYEEATDGGLVYAERAGNGRQGSIDLGDSGLWSTGIDRLPTGTLLVVGPIELDQSTWESAAQRVDMACVHALNPGHRVAILVDTPTPETLHEDLVLMVRSMAEDPSEDTYTALVGVVTEDGELQQHQPFSQGYPAPTVVHVNSGLDALPALTREALRQELTSKRSGIVLLGSSEITENTAYEQMVACLALTEHVGPVARIMPRHRSTPAKDWMVPDAIKALPFLPSVESAYAQGYKRIIVSSHYTEADTLLNYDDAMFFCGTYGHDIGSISMHPSARSGNSQRAIMARIIAVLGLLQIPSKSGAAVASDLFIRGDLLGPTEGRFVECEEYLRENRLIRWEDELTSLLDTKAVTVAAVKKANARNRDVQALLSGYRTSKKVA